MDVINKRNHFINWHTALLLVTMLVISCYCQNEYDEEETVIRYSIQEEVLINTYIGNIAESAGLTNSNTTLQFGFLSNTAPNTEFFTIKETTGELRTARRIDRDQLCPGFTECELSIDVAIRGGPGLFQIIKIVVSIEDINDHMPEFNNKDFVLYLSESTQVGAVFALPVAEDADVGDNGVVSYILDPQLSQFGLSGSHPECQLVVKEALDREHIPEYNLTLSASDAAGHSAHVKLRIIILDANDNAPVFEQSEYNITVFEDAAIGSTLIQLLANDPDHGSNARITYKFSTQTQAQYGKVYRLDSFTGDLVTMETLNYARTSEYSLRVVAFDDGASSLAGYATVIVRVQDLNDHAPVIDVNALTAVPEHSQMGNFVAHVSVTDEDGGDNGKFTCSLDNRNFDLIKVFGTEYKLVTAAVFDREALSEYSVRISCQDLGSPPQESTKDVIVAIEDINDNPPRFLKDDYEFNVVENTELGASVGQVIAKDADIGDNGRLTYSLSPGSVLDIDKESGVLTVLHPLDHEERTIWDIQVKVSDNGNPRSLSVSAMIRLNILDTNDETPHFPQASYTFTVRENDPAGMRVGEVVAYDRDEAPYNKLTYSLDPTGAKYLSIDPSQGIISTALPLDREQTAMLVFRVSAHDVGGLSTSVQVQILVQDDNDHAPVIDVPEAPVQIPANAKVGETVYHVIASDEDTSNNAALRYTLMSSSIPDLFSLNPLSGALSIAQSLSLHSEATVAMTVRVRDHGNPPLATTSSILLHINDSITSSSHYSSGSTHLLSDTSFIIILLLSSTAVISIILIAVIIYLLRRRRFEHCKRPAHPSSDPLNPMNPVVVVDKMMTSTPKTQNRKMSNDQKEIPTVDGSLQRLNNNLAYDEQNTANAKLNGQQKPRRVHFQVRDAATPSAGPSTGLIQGPPDYKDETRHRLLYGSGSMPSNLTQQQLQVHNVLLPSRPSNNNPSNNAGAVAMDQEWERGSSDSGRGASEEENNSAESLSVPPRGSSSSSSRRQSGSRNGDRSRMPGLGRKRVENKNERDTRRRDDGKTEGGACGGGSEDTAPPLPKRTIAAPGSYQHPNNKPYNKPPARPPPPPPSHGPTLHNPVPNHARPVPNTNQSRSSSNPNLNNPYNLNNNSNSKPPYAYNSDSRKPREPHGAAPVLPGKDTCTDIASVASTTSGEYFLHLNEPNDDVFV